MQPMLAVLADPPLDDPRLAYEPKYDGIRALAHVDGSTARIWSRLGNEKTAQFPELARALGRLGARLKRPILLDGEIVAVDPRGEALGFQQLQARVHLQHDRDIERAMLAQPVAFITFDLLREADEDVRGQQFRERRERLERLLARRTNALIRLTPVSYGNGRLVLEEARAHGWEGIIAKDVGASYQSGRRSPAWRKLKVGRQQEFVVGGWTDPRLTRQHFGALLLGVSSAPRRSRRAVANSSLAYAGSVGTGFSEDELARVAARLKPLETHDCPFAAPPATAERAHWVQPTLVAQVKFAEWTADGKLRAPVYLGLRDDVRPQAVARERKREKVKGQDPASGVLRSIVARLEDLENRRRDGVIEVPGEGILKVTNLAKVFWPELRITKGELLRYYALVSPFILPVLRDRPLVMKRFPNGIAGKPFYQQRVLDEVPEGVRVETVQEGEGEEPMARFVGGSLLTLLYTTQLAAISQDPWFSRVQSTEEPDCVALDLDPQPEVKFTQTLEVARRIGEVLEKLGTPAVPKTSGSRGLHIFIPLPAGASYESGRLFCEIVATAVAERHPKIASVERTVSARGRTVYIDFLQNIRGKTLASAYSVRANEFAGVSTPFTWREVDDGFDPRDFTLRNVDARIRDVGDVWKRLRTSKPADLRVALRLKT